MKMSDVAQAMDTDPALEARMRENPAATMRSLAAIPLQTDVWIYRAVVAMLGTVVVLTVVSVAVLAFFDKSLPEGIYVLAGTCAGAMASLINQSKS